MPTVFSHPAVPLCIGLGLGQRFISPRLLAAGAVASVVPDLDVLGWHLGVAYGAAWGHRGATHSLAFAFFLGMLAAAAAPWLRTGRWRALAFVWLSAASHGLLDMLTDGGRGVALWWPWSTERLFAPLRMIEVSPISWSRFVSARGVEVMASELVWLWAPCAVFAIALRLTVSGRSNPHRPGASGR